MIRKMVRLDLEDHLMAGGNTSGNSILFLANLASTMIPSIFFRLGTFLRA